MTGPRRADFSVGALQPSVTEFTSFRPSTLPAITTSTPSHERRPRRVRLRHLTILWA